MASFTQWLQQQTERDDQAGELARLWKSYEGNRPKVYSPMGVRTFLTSQNVEGASDLVTAVQDIYHTGRGDLRVAADADAQLAGLADQLGHIAEDIALIKDALGIGAAQVPAYADPLATPEAAMASAEAALQQTTQERMRAMAEKSGWLRAGEGQSAAAAVSDGAWADMWQNADHDAVDAS
jgi:hypothetical protein